MIGDPRPDPSLDDCTLAGPRTYISVAGKNVGDLLNAKNVTWGWFQGGFKPTSATPAGVAVCAAHHTGISGDDAKTTSGDYIPHHEPFQYYKQSANPHHLPPTSIAAIGSTDQANHQYDTSDFFSALAAGNLPAVSYVKAAAYQDGHAAYSNPLDEQTFVVNTVNSIMQSPMMFCLLQSGSRLSQDEETALFLVPGGAVRREYMSDAERRAGGKGAAVCAAAQRTLAAEHRSATGHRTTDGAAGTRNRDSRWWVPERFQTPPPKRSWESPRTPSCSSASGR